MTFPIQVYCQRVGRPQRVDFGPKLLHRLRTSLPYRRADDYKVPEGMDFDR